MERGKGGEGEKRERRWNGPDGGEIICQDPKARESNHHPLTHCIKMYFFF